MDDREMIEIGGETGDWEHDRRTVSRAELIGIMRPRVEEILEEVRARLDAAGFEHLPPADRADRRGEPDPRARRAGAEDPWPAGALGRPLRVQGCRRRRPARASPRAVGLCLFAAHPQDEWWDFECPATATRRARCAGGEMVQGQLVNPRCRSRSAKSRRKV
jgi:cell division protein FtsA